MMGIPSAYGPQLETGSYRAKVTTWFGKARRYGTHHVLYLSATDICVEVEKNGDGGR